MQVPPTPVELRARRRDEQSRVRKAVNVLNRALDLWKAAHNDGLTAATAASNAYLQKWYIPAMAMGVLAKVPDLKEAAQAKLQTCAERHIVEVAEAVACCRDAVHQLRSAADLLDTPEDSLIAATEHAVFAALSLPLIAQEVGKIVAEYEAELDIKAAVLEGLQQATEGRPGPKPKGTLAQQDQVRRNHMQVLLTSWMLQPRIDPVTVECTMAMLAAEMKGF